TFIKSLKESAPVRSPIRKTNVILKEPNFIKALELWEFLEKNLIKPVTSVEKSHEESKDQKIRNVYDLAFFMEHDILREKKTDGNEVLSYAYLSKVVNDFVFSSNMSETEFKKLLNKEYKEASKRKEKVTNDIRKTFRAFVDEFEKQKKKAFSLLK
ncbi:MAG: hypothetical protein K2M17_00310, partial [Bacilli bacterium]|nr:hypothetical protein [Bacilli bacterium]